LSDKTKDDATTERNTKSNKEQSKSPEEVRREKEITIDANIMDIFDENETTPLSQLYLQNTIKEKLGNTNISTNQVGHMKNQLRNFKDQRLVLKETEWKLE